MRRRLVSRVPLVLLGKPIAVGNQFPLLFPYTFPPALLPSGASDPTLLLADCPLSEGDCSAVGNTQACRVRPAFRPGPVAPLQLGDFALVTSALSLPLLVCKRDITDLVPIMPLLLLNLFQFLCPFLSPCHSPAITNKKWPG